MLQLAAHILEATGSSSSIAHTSARPGDRSVAADIDKIDGRYAGSRASA